MALLATSFCALVLVLTLSNTVSAQGRISVTPKGLVRLDTTAPGTLHKMLVVKNIGDGPLKISEIRKSCGCTNIPLERDVLQPNDTIQLRVGLNLRENKGEQAKDVYIVSSDPIDSVIPINFSVFLARDVETTPSRFPAGLNIPIDIDFYTAVDVFNTGEDTITLSHVEFKADKMIARFNQISGIKLPPKRSTKLQAIVLASEPGYHIGSVLIHSNSRYSPTVSVDLVCMVADPSSIGATDHDAGSTNNHTH